MKRAVLIPSLLVALVAASAPSFAQAPAPARAVPKLVVILVVDQMRADYVTTYGDRWTGGLRRLTDEGAWFRKAAYPYGATVTCVGHSTIATGSLPSTHGIVGNSWFDREAGEVVQCASDPHTQVVPYGEGPASAGHSTRNLMTSTLPDEMRLQMASPPRVVTVSLKTYTASVLAGRRPDAAIWLDGSTGQWVASTAFSAEPLPWLARVIGRQKLDALAGEVWRKALPADAYSHEDDGVGERPLSHWTTTFPHPLSANGEKPGEAFLSAWQTSPFSDARLAQLAIGAVDELKLGQGDGTDYLAISFTALDSVGHRFGPRSHEVQDLLAHLDETIGTLLTHLDKTLAGRYVLALTADHGVAPIPEQVVAQGLRGGRFPSAGLVERVEKALQRPLGAGEHVANFSGNDLTFKPGVWERLRANPEALRSVMDAIREVPAVAAAFHRDELDGVTALPEDPLAKAAAAGYYRGRSGDIIVYLRPYWLYGSGTNGTSHGSPYAYDQGVPLILFGEGIKPGVYFSQAAPVDIAPTFAALCGITLPAADGRVLAEALR